MTGLIACPGLLAKTLNPLAMAFTFGLLHGLGFAGACGFVNYLCP